MKKFCLFLSILVFSLYAQEPKKLPEIPSLSIDATNTPPQPQTAQMPTPQAQPLPQAQEAPQQAQPQQLPQAQEPMQNVQNMPPIPPVTAQEQPQPTQEAFKKERDPFQPVITPKVSGQISNAPQLNLFTKTELALPSTARKIKKITIEYQNLNGSVATIDQELDGDVDWHFPLILSQEVQPKVANIPTTESFNLDKEFDFTITKSGADFSTRFELLRDFTLASPTRLVLDFKAPLNRRGEVASVLKDSFVAQIPTIKEVRLTTHLDFYRLTFLLDGQYKYNIKSGEKKGNFNIELY